MPVAGRCTTAHRRPAGPTLRAVQNIDEPRPASPVPAWAEQALAAALTLCFAIALGLRVGESDDSSRSVQFVLLGAAIAFAVALVAVRRRGAAADDSADGARDAHLSR
jgi:hypothetical protein